MHTSNPPSWYAIVHFGTYGPVDRTPPHGPYRSRELAEAALNRFIGQLGQHGGNYLAATSIRVVGPFPTRAVARGVNISNYPQYIKYAEEHTMNTITAEHASRASRTATDEALIADRAAALEAFDAIRHAGTTDAEYNRGTPVARAEYAAALEAADIKYRAAYKAARAIDPNYPR